MVADLCPLAVIPAEAGIQAFQFLWTSAFAGVTIDAWVPLLAGPAVHLSESSLLANQQWHPNTAPHLGKGVLGLVSRE